MHQFYAQLNIAYAMLFHLIATINFADESEPWTSSGVQFCGGNNCGVIVGETSLTISWHESPRSSVFSFFFLFLLPSSALGAQDWSRFTVFRIQPLKVKMVSELS